MNLRLDWATHEAAKYAVMTWHYSKRMPSGKVCRFGVWENGEFKGVVIYGRGAAQNIGSPFGLDQTEICELVRVALHGVSAETSKIVAVSLRLLKKNYPKLRAVVSYADTFQNHFGTIYQASNWGYLGRSRGDVEVFINGKWVHRSRRKSTGVQKRKTGDKHKYIFLFDDKLKPKLDSMLKPYPKRAGSIDSDASTYQGLEGGVIPTPALHSHSEKQCT